MNCTRIKAVAARLNTAAALVSSIKLNYTCTWYPKVDDGLMMISHKSSPVPISLSARESSSAVNMSKLPLQSVGGYVPV